MILLGKGLGEIDDVALSNLRSLDFGQLEIDGFEKELLQDAQQAL